MKRQSFRCADDVTRRSLMHHAPPLVDERRPERRAFDARRDLDPAMGVFNAVVISIVIVLVVALGLHLIGRMGL